MKQKNDKISRDSIFCYYNCNPHHVNAADCVVRAISEGQGESWEDVAKDLFQYMLNTGHMINSPELYSVYLKDKGWVKQKQPKSINGKKIKIKDFVKTFKGHAIIHAGRDHVSYVADGRLWDTWNCEDEIIGVYWIPNDEIK